jgi:hypothetical protein
LVSEATDGTVTVSPPSEAPPDSSDGAALIAIQYWPNPSTLLLNQFFSGQPGPDLYTDTYNISTTTVSSTTATRFAGLSVIPSDDAIVIPVVNGFVAVLASVPEALLVQFLSTLRVQ